jgi:hypothetical protein
VHWKTYLIYPEWTPGKGTGAEMKEKDDTNILSKKDSSMGTVSHKMGDLSPPSLHL